MNDSPRRVRVAWEGLPTPDGRLIEPGALSIEGEQVPLTVHYAADEDHPDRYDMFAIGWARDIKREEIRGMTSVTMLLTHPIIGLGPTITMVDMESEARINTPHTIITKARIAGIHLSPYPVWPDLVLT